jgi:hypothetical protein
MYIVNMSGPRTDPWGTPLVREKLLETAPSHLTEKVLDVR